MKTHAKSEENIENITKSDGNVASSFADYDVLPDIIFHGNCLINNNNVYLSKKKVNIYIYIYIYIYNSLQEIQQEI